MGKSIRHKWVKMVILYTAFVMALKKRHIIDPLVTNGFSHSYELGESTFMFWGIRIIFLFLFHFSMKFTSTSRIVPDRASHLGIFRFLLTYFQEKRTPGLYGFR